MSKHCYVLGSPVDIDTPKIVNGRNVDSIEKYPWVVALYGSSGTSRPFCGGTLLDSTTIITAGHCSTGQTPSRVQALAHRLDQKKSPKDEQSAFFKVNSIKVHPKYDDSGDDADNNIWYDVAIWKVTLVSGVAPTTQVVLNKGELDVPGSGLTVVGWGATRYAGSSSSILKETDVPVTTNEVCFKGYPKLETNPTAMCAGFADGRTDACNGDSGGPLFAIKDGKVILTGIVSTGFECARPNKPGIYTRISYIVDWINQNK
ncbi:trypsin-like cysteine/serine peptidase domain-containing protein [Globomyces pollinis-pini]|nr:trypsin-like cysteine/serine peptidase domain-containing protein [Globomyces pollinis-pini]